MPRYFDVRHTVLLVVGYGLLAEEEDRPVAYALKQAIDARGQGRESCAGVVVTDMWILNQEMANLFPAISIGGPGVNAFTSQIYEELPVLVAREERMFIQADRERGKRAALWGMDNAATREAADVFVREGLLDQFLDLAWHRKS
jgi:hypothetical protein